MVTLLYYFYTDFSKMTNRNESLLTIMAITKKKSHLNP